MATEAGGGWKIEFQDNSSDVALRGFHKGSRWWQSILDTFSSSLNDLANIQDSLKEFNAQTLTHIEESFQRIQNLLRSQGETSPTTTLSLDDFTETTLGTVHGTGQEQKKSLHPVTIFIIIGSLCVAQFLLVKWKTVHYKSYQRTTLLGMWLVPIGVSLKNLWLCFCIVWAIFSTVTALVTLMASRKPLSGSTPRWVYKWFLFLYKVSYATGLLGYLIFISTFFGIYYLVRVEQQTAVNVSCYLLFYGLYFGVISRDFAEVCADTMATHIGYYSSTDFPTKRLDTKMCALCGNELFLTSNDSVVIEKIIKLTCGHAFHEFCIRGWCIVGKKQTCPHCKEKVDLKRMFPGPWERPHVMYGRFLDLVRYLVSWHPLIIVILHLVIKLLFGRALLRLPVTTASVQFSDAKLTGKSLLHLLMVLLVTILAKRVGTPTGSQPGQKNEQLLKSDVSGRNAQEQLAVYSSQLGSLNTGSPVVTPVKDCFPAMRC